MFGVLYSSATGATVFVGARATVGSEVGVDVGAIIVAVGAGRVLVGGISVGATVGAMAMVVAVGCAVRFGLSRSPHATSKRVIAHTTSRRVKAKWVFTGLSENLRIEWAQV